MNTRIEKIEIISSIGGKLWGTGEGKIEKRLVYSDIRAMSKHTIKEDWQGLHESMKIFTLQGDFEICGLVDDVFIRVHLACKNRPAVIVFEKWLPLTAKVFEPFFYADWR